MEIVRKDPRLMALYARSRRTELSTNYGPFCRKIGLSAEQLQRLGDAMLEEQLARQDLFGVRDEQGLRWDDPGLAALGRKVTAKLREDEIAVLGDDGYRQLKEYERILEVRNYVRDLAGTGLFAGVTIEPAQAEALIPIIANACPQYQRGGSASVGQTDWPTVDAQARTILSPQQMRWFTSGAPFGSTVGSRWSSAIAAELKRTLESSQAVETQLPERKPPDG